jgi:hypothetical protein
MPKPLYIRSNLHSYCDILTSNHCFDIEQYRKSYSQTKSAELADLVAGQLTLNILLYKYTKYTDLPIYS